MSSGTTLPLRLSDIGITRYRDLAAIPEETLEAAIAAHDQADEPISTASVARVAAALGDLTKAANEELVARGKRKILIAEKRKHDAREREGRD